MSKSTNEYRRQWYQKNLGKERERLRKSNKRRKVEIAEWFETYKVNLSCKECGESHIGCLDFHHRNPDEKDFEVSVAVCRGWSRERILAEVEKCDVLCANCHRKFHWRQRRPCSSAD